MNCPVARVPALESLNPERSRELLSTYDRAVSARRWTTAVILAAIVALAALSGWVAEVQPGTFVDNIHRFTSYVGRILPSLSVGNFRADVVDWYWRFGVWAKLLGETLLIAYLGTLFGVIGALALCFAASQNLGRSAGIRLAVRRALEFLRTVPEVVFALLFVIAFGLGPMPGVLALGLHTMGALGKLFFEAVENIDMKPVEGVRSTGASRLQAIRFAALPQVAPSFASYALLRFEINVRGASVMGFVGAGGIGQELITSIRQFYYTDVSAILLMIVMTVMMIDMVAEKIRHRLIGFQGGVS